MANGRQGSMDRRRFLKMVGAAAGAVTLADLAAACSSSSPAPAATSAPAAAPAATKPAASAPAAPAASTKGKTIRVAYVHGAGGTSEMAANDFVKFISEQTKGEYTAQIFPGGQLGGERDMVESQQMGSIEVGWYGGYLVSNLAPEYGNILETPYVMQSVAHFRKVVDGSEIKPAYDKMLKDKGIRHIAWTNRGPRYLTSNKAVKTPADVKGMKIRVPEIETYVAAWKALGATVVPMAFPEVFMALKQGTIDAQENPLENAMNGSFYDVQKYVNLTAHIYTGFELTVSEKWYSALPADVQKIVTDGIVLLCKNQDKYQAEAEDKLAKDLQAKGMTFNQPDLASF
ncbi:MAG TPA: TRAP transporter substrate-binding protein, partial [Chloroflexota bacterium]|nr:TRAP transporter substrate-binding protein [Chloroflexota bacterium]